MVAVGIPTGTTDSFCRAWRNARRSADAPALYYPYVEPQPGECRGVSCGSLRSSMRGHYGRLSDCAACGENDGRPMCPSASSRSTGTVYCLCGQWIRHFPRPMHFGDSCNALCESTCSIHPRPILSCGRPATPEVSAAPHCAMAGRLPRLLSCETAVLAALPIDHSVTPVPERRRSSGRPCPVEEVLGEETGLVPRTS